MWPPHVDHAVLRRRNGHSYLDASVSSLVVVTLRHLAARRVGDWRRDWPRLGTDDGDRADL